jgi:hypothetical protein
VSKEEALQYLKLQKIDDEQAAQIYEFVGGRMIHLKSIAEDIRGGATLEGMCTACYTETVSHLLYSSAPDDVLRRQKSTQVR